MSAKVLFQQNLLFLYFLKTKKTYLPFLSKEGKACLNFHTLADKLEKLSASYLGDC